jgi:hypothetical protein
MKSFSSFAGFAAEFATAALAVEELNHRMLEHAAVCIEERAKEKIGEYQKETGEFVAWAELAESTKQDREEQGYSENEPGLRSGEMRDSIEHQSSAVEAHVGSNDQNLVWFELGTVKQPPRSVLGGAAFEKAAEVVELIGTQMTMHLAGEGVFLGKLPI